MKTLIVEDSATLCAIYSQYLDGSGLDVTAVETLASARDTLVDLNPQLILLDIELPDGNGLDLMDDLWRVIPRPAVVVMTGHGADFAELAKEKATGPCGPNGGELGTFGRGQMVPAFETADFALPAGSFSAKPVQTQFCWHVIKVSEKAVKPAPSFDAMRDQLVNSLSRQHLGRVIESMRADQTIELRSFEDVRNEVQAKAQ